jgi:hypothetical protein
MMASLREIGAQRYSVAGRIFFLSGMKWPHLRTMKVWTRGYLLSREAYKRNDGSLQAYNLFRIDCYRPPPKTTPATSGY